MGNRPDPSARATLDLHPIRTAEVDGQTMGWLGFLDKHKRSQTLSLADLIKECAQGHKIGITPMPDSAADIPRGRTGDTVFLYTVDGQLLLRFGAQAEVIDTETEYMYSNDLFTIAFDPKTKELSFLYSSGEGKKMLGMPKNRLVEEDQVLGRAALEARASENNALPVQEIDRVSESVSAVLEHLDPEALVPEELDPEELTGHEVVIPLPETRAVEKTFSRSTRVIPLTGGLVDFPVDANSIDDTVITVLVLGDDDDSGDDRYGYTIRISRGMVSIANSRTPEKEVDLMKEPGKSIKARHFFASVQAGRLTLKSDAGEHGLVVQEKIVRFKKEPKAPHAAPLRAPTLAIRAVPAALDEAIQEVMAELVDMREVGIEMSSKDPGEYVILSQPIDGSAPKELLRIVVFCNQAATAQVRSSGEILPFEMLVNDAISPGKFACTIRRDKDGKGTLGVMGMRQPIVLARLKPGSLGLNLDALRSSTTAEQANAVFRERVDKRTRQAPPTPKGLTTVLPSSPGSAPKLPSVEGVQQGWRDQLAKLLPKVFGKFGYIPLERDED